MQFYNLKKPEQVVNFKQAVMQGIGENSGLFFPLSWPELEPETIESLLDMPFVERSVALFQRLLKDEFEQDVVEAIVRKAFNFPILVKPVNERVQTLELFHGPTLAFKDFGCRFFAECVNAIRNEDKGSKQSQKNLTIVTATSGDTGAAVAHAFYKKPNVDVHVLYPKGKISQLQEKLFCTLGDNIHTYAVASTFDQCQSMVKQTFTDSDIVDAINLNSANSINVSRLLAQVAYYFEAAVQVRHQELVISVPSGNFGNLTAGLMAKALGAPIKRFVIGTNDNDTVPRYLVTKHWQPQKTVETISNAMDISDPSNWPRVEAILKYKGWQLDNLAAAQFNDAEAAEGAVSLLKQGYLSEPHGAIAYLALEKQLHSDEVGVFVGTAEPSKFNIVVEEIIGQSVPVPERLASYVDRAVLSKDISGDFDAFKGLLLQGGNN